MSLSLERSRKASQCQRRCCPLHVTSRIPCHCARAHHSPNRLKNTDRYRRCLCSNVCCSPSRRGDLGVDPCGRPPRSTTYTLMAAVPPAQGGIQVLGVAVLRLPRRADPIVHVISTNWNDMEKSSITHFATSSGLRLNGIPFYSRKIF